MRRMSLIRAVRLIHMSILRHATCLHRYAGDMSEALRNLALGHANSGPFQRHYLGRQVAADTWAILRGQKPQKALMKQACSVGHSISKRRPTDLTPEQAASVNTDPIIRRLQRELQDLPQGSEAYKVTRLKLRSEKMRLKRRLKEKIRYEWTAKQAVDDIEGQLMGGWQPTQTVDKPCHPQRPAQKHLVQALSAPSDNTLEGQYRRRNDAMDAVITYCVVEEGSTIRRSTVSAVKSSQGATTSDPQESHLRLALRSVLITEKTERARRCFMCVGKALSVAPDDAILDDLLHEFYMASDVTKHFRRRHLSRLQDDDKIYCQVCQKWLEHKMHFQNHALRAHGLLS